MKRLFVYGLISGVITMYLLNRSVKVKVVKDVVRYHTVSAVKESIHVMKLRGGYDA